MVIKYSETTGSILFEDARRKTFVQYLANKAYTIHSADNQLQYRGKSSSRGPNLTRNKSKSKDTQTCYYYRKLGHIKANCWALKAKNEKAQRYEQNDNRMEEVKFCGSSSINTVRVIMQEDPNILTIKSMTMAKVLRTTKQATS